MSVNSPNQAVIKSGLILGTCSFLTVPCTYNQAADTLHCNAIFKSLFNRLFEQRIPR